MFYEEEFRDGIWMFRTTPNGEFRPMSLEMLNEKAAELTERCAQAERLREALTAFVCNSSVQVNFPSECEKGEAALSQWEAE